MTATEIIRAMIKSSSFTQHKLAKSLGGSHQSYVSMLLAHDPYTRNFYRCAEAMGFEIVARSKETGKEFTLSYDSESEVAK